MRDYGDDVRELLHDGHPIACVQDSLRARVVLLDVLADARQNGLQLGRLRRRRSHAAGRQNYEREKKGDVLHGRSLAQGSG